METRHRVARAGIFAVLLAGAAAASAAPAGSSAARGELEAAYAAMAKALNTANARLYLRYLAPEFIEIDRDGAVRTRRQWGAAPGQLAGVHGATYTVSQVTVRGREAVVFVTAGGAVETPSPEVPVVEYTTRRRDTWVRTAAGWRLKRSEQIVKGRVPVNDRALALQRVCRIADAALTAIMQPSPADPSFAVLARDGSIRRFDMRGRPIGALVHPGESATAFAYSPDGSQLMAGTQSGKVLVFDLRAGTPRVAFAGAGGPAARVAWLHGTSRGVVTTTVGHAEMAARPAGFVFDLSNGETLYTFSAFSRGDYQTLATSPDGNQVAVLDVPGRGRGAFVLEAAGGRIHRALCHSELGPLSVVFGPDNNTVAVGCAPNSLILWDSDRQQLRRVMQVHHNWVVSLAFSPDGRMLVSGAGDGTARLWNAATAKEIGRIRFWGEDPFSSTYVHSVGFSHDGTCILAAAENGEVLVMRAPKPRSPLTPLRCSAPRRARGTPAAPRR